MSKKDEKLATATLKRTVEHAFFEVFYHAHERAKDVEKVANAEALIRLSGLEITREQATKLYEDAGEDEYNISIDTLDNVIAVWFARLLWGVKWHDEKLAAAEEALPGVLFLVKKSGLKIDIDAIREAQRKRATRP